MLELYNCLCIGLCGKIWVFACGNRFVTWYFRLGEWLSPERNYQETHCCSCAKPCLGELRSLKRDTSSSKRPILAWARVRPGFWVLPLLGPRPGEIDSPKRDGLSPKLDWLTWAKDPVVGYVMLYFKGWIYMFERDYVQLTSFVNGMCC